MRQAIDRFIKRHHLLKKGAVVVVGVSGGPDSMALLDYLETVKHSWDLTLVAASADHGLRGTESAADVSYVKSYCHDKEIAFEWTRLAVKEYQREHHVSEEVAARTCRYHFFADVMNRHSGDILALAHHGDDQVETMLMRQVRGSIGGARSGIPVRRPFENGEIIRPLLTVDKQQIEAYCKERNLVPRRDPSNDSDAYTRNRFRHHVLPFLKAENPNVHVRFQYESEMLHDDHEYLLQLARTRLSDCLLSKNSDGITLSVETFSMVPMALQRRMIPLILNYLYRQIPPSLSVLHIEEVLQLLKSRHPSARLDFPMGLQVVRSYDRLVFTYKKEEVGPYQHTLNVPGEIYVPAGTILAEFAREYRKHPDDLDAFVCDADLVCLPFLIRTRQPGDRLSPKGMKGSKKVKAIFIDRKIHRSLREKWPLVTDANGAVLWVPGLKHSGVAEPSWKTERLVVLRFQPSGNAWEDVQQ